MGTGVSTGTNVGRRRVLPGHSAPHFGCMKVGLFSSAVFRKQLIVLYWKPHRRDYQIQEHREKGLWPNSSRFLLHSTATLLSVHSLLFSSGSCDSPASRVWRNLLRRMGRREKEREKERARTPDLRGMTTMTTLSCFRGEGV